MAEVQYDPSVFMVQNQQQALEIILTPEVGLTPEQRLEKETAWLLPKLVFDDYAGQEEPLIIDYGCGPGRLSKYIAHNTIGVDISPGMRAIAEQYVARPNFIATHPPGFDMLVKSGLCATGALAIWVLQHIPKVKEDIGMLAAALLPGARFWVMNRNHRAIPIRDAEGKFGWVDDNLDVEALLLEHFEGIKEIDVPETLCKPGAWLRCYRRRS